MTKELIELGLKLKRIIGKKELEDGDYELPYGVYFNIDKRHEWVSDGKYDSSECVVRVIVDGSPTDLYLQQFVSRSGSYYSDYEYYYNEVEIVEKKTKVVTVVDYVPLRMV